mmetsp:Transcript_12979/g.37327  ORF Transcript_12979/g.37327 Transcript_12979/m.37327 type:complete len:241 (-) Transcript_12979:263-985(-)
MHMGRWLHDGSAAPNSKRPTCGPPHARHSLVCPVGFVVTASRKAAILQKPMWLPDGCCSCLQYSAAQTRAQRPLLVLRRRSWLWPPGTTCGTRHRNSLPPVAPRHPPAKLAPRSAPPSAHPSAPPWAPPSAPPSADRRLRSAAQPLAPRLMRAPSRCAQPRCACARGSQSHPSESSTLPHPRRWRARQSLAKQYLTHPSEILPKCHGLAQQQLRPRHQNPLRHPARSRHCPRALPHRRRQ